MDAQKRAAEQEVVLKAINEEIGTFLYKIKLKAKDDNKKKTIQLSVEVGKVGVYDLKIENPRVENVNVHYSLSNNKYFVIEGPEMLYPG